MHIISHLSFIPLPTNDRIFDLDHSCTYGENGCECKDAKQRVENNEIICEKGITECPDECPICNYCMESLGCL